MNLILSVNNVATSGGSGSGVFFAPNVDAATSVVSMFDAQNNLPYATLDTTIVRPGHTKSILLTYTNDEDGTDLIVLGQSIGGQFVPTPRLFCRSYERFDGPWEGNWPQGLKTARYYTRPDNTTTGPLPGGYSYCSEKIIYPGYVSGGAPDPRDDDFVIAGSWAYLDRPEIGATYTSGQTFGNGLPYIRTGHWYKWERWMVQNSAPDVADGVLQLWIDDVLVLNRTNVNWKTALPNAYGADVPNGTNWESMWFGGNYSSTGRNPTSTLYRRISDPYLSSTLDR